MKNIFRKIAAVTMSAAMLALLSSCGEKKPVGNIGDVELTEGDVYAVIKIMDYGEITAKLFPEVAPLSVQKFTELSEQGFYELKTVHRVIDNYTIQGGSLNGDGTDGEIPDSDYIPLEVNDAARHFYGALCFAGNSKGSFSQFYIVDNNTPQDISAAVTTLSEQLGNEEITDRLLPEDLKYYEDYLEKLETIPPEVSEKYASVGGLYQLDGTQTVFGQVIDGFDVLEQITSSEVVTGNKIDDDAGIPSKPINSIVIESVEIIKIEPAETTTEESKKPGKKTTATEEIVVETVPTTTAPETTPESTRKPVDTLVSIG